MKFSSITIKNFRNFEDITDLQLNNRNIFFGMNDVGKSNFLAALRFVFDYNFRKNGFQQTDFHKLDYDNKVIEIIVKLDISNDNKFSNMLRAKAKGTIRSGATEFYIKVNSNYNGDLKQFLCELSWGSELEDLVMINSNNAISDLDRLFDVVYIGSSIDIEILFKKHFSTLVNRKNDDLDEIKEAVNNLKLKYKELESIKSIESTLDTEYKKIARNDFRISLAPVEINLDPYKSITPMLNTGEDKDYPLSGDGQRKITAYALTRLISLKSDKKIHLFLIEEPENHLHRTSLLKLSMSIFNENEYPYLFVTTHSSELLSEMDNVNLIRIFGRPIVAKSCFYQVPEQYSRLKNILNTNLAAALFYNKVLLVEGPSELILFDHILKNKYAEYKTEGNIILPVNGTGFENYIRILTSIGIVVIVKTDNDLRKKNNSATYELLGLKRLKKILSIYKSLGIKTEISINFDENIDMTLDQNDIRNQIYLNNLNNISIVESEFKTFISKIDLENDLNEAIGNEMKEYLNTENAVEYLQKNKMKNMAELVLLLKEDDLTKILDHPNFKCIKELMPHE